MTTYDYEVNTVDLRGNCQGGLYLILSVQNIRSEQYFLATKID